MDALKTRNGKDDKADLKKYAKLRRELKKKLMCITMDFLVAQDSLDFIHRISLLDLKSNIEQVPKILMSVSFDRNELERKLVADLIVELVMRKIIVPKDLSKSFTILLSQLSDLLLDIPNLVAYLEYYVNRFIDSKVLEYGDSKNFMELLSIYSGANSNQTVKKIVTKIFGNYFMTAELAECCREVEEINDQSVYPLVVKYSVSLALDRGDQERELLSKFFACVVDDMSNSKFIKQRSLSEGFIILLNCIEDLYDDVPNVYHYLSFFIARAITDDCLPPIFLKNSREKIGGDAYIVLDNAQKLLDMENSVEQLLKVWDCNVENVDQIKLIVKRNVQAFFDSKGDVTEFHCFMRKLGHPHFHYQVVYQIFSTLLDRRLSFLDPACDLILSLVSSGISSQDQIDQGFKKVEQMLPDLRIDVPKAEEIYAKVKSRIYNRGKI